jgi:hypothetical protein
VFLSYGVCVCVCVCVRARAPRMDVRACLCLVDLHGDWNMVVYIAHGLITDSVFRLYNQTN